VQRSIAPALIVAVALLAAGCGANAVPNDDVAAAADATKAQGSARVESVSRSSFHSRESVFRSTGVVDYANDRHEEVIEYPAAGDSPPLRARVIGIGHVSWSEIPADSTLSAPAGKRWLRSDPAGTEAMVAKSSETNETENGSSTGMVIFSSASVGASPDDFLEYLSGVAPDPERVGEERVRGVETTHYRTQLGLRRATRRELERDGWDERNIQRALDGLEDGPVAIDIWIGVDGLIRRIVSQSEGAGDDSWSTESTTEFFDFGVETDIRQPPPGEVIEQAEWLRLIEADQKWLQENQVVGEEP
jgi:hypothetical protein